MTPCPRMLAWFTRRNGAPLRRRYQSLGRPAGKVPSRSLSIIHVHRDAIKSLARCKSLPALVSNTKAALGCGCRISTQSVKRTSARFPARQIEVREEHDLSAGCGLPSPFLRAPAGHFSRRKSVRRPTKILERPLAADHAGCHPFSIPLSRWLATDASRG